MIPLSDIARRAAWAAFAPRLHIEDAGLLRAPPLAYGGNRCAALRERLLIDGYFQEGGNAWAADPALLAETVRALARAGLPPVFGFLYDEFWLPFRQLDPLFREVLGPYAMLPDFWIWNVDPARGEAGWTPHRDKGHTTLRPDGLPQSLTVWVPLSAATPLNSCMYIVPARDDPTYGTPREGDWRFDLASVRALPAAPGDVLVWNQAVLHWGSKSAAHGGESRISMAVEFQRADVAPMNMPLIKPLAALPFEVRLKLIAKQVLQYRHMYAVAPALEQAMTRLVESAA